MGPARRGAPQAVNQIAESYVRLVLAVGQHDPDYVDAYYGPAEWRTQAAGTLISLGELHRRAADLIGQLDQTESSGQDEHERLRHQYLSRQLQSLASRVSILSGATLSFDEESRALYDAVAPTVPEARFEDVLDRLNGLLPGEGALIDRYDAFRRAFVVPREQLDRVFVAAIGACRERTRTHIDLPADESFTVEYVTGKSWSGYNWYQGNYRSFIQVNTDLPIYIDRAIDLACHEGYPGHHVYNVLLEQHLVRARGWVEFSVYALFSPQSLIAEGTANAGIDVAFPADRRVEFERGVLFPLAGLSPSRADEYYTVLRLVNELSHAGNEAARRYLDGLLNASQAADWLIRYAMMSPPRAEQRVRFFDQYRSYVINYTLGKDLVRQYLESRGGTADQPEVRWREFEQLLCSPRLPSGLR